MSIIHRLNPNSFIEASIIEHKIPRCSSINLEYFIPKFKDYWNQWHTFKIGNGYPEQDYSRVLAFKKREDCERFLSLIEGNFLERSRHGDGWSKINLDDYSENKLIEKFDKDSATLHKIKKCHLYLDENYRVIEIPLLNGEVGYFPDFGVVKGPSPYFNFITLDFTQPKYKRNILYFSSLNDALEVLKLIQKNSYSPGTFK